MSPSDLLQIRERLGLSQSQAARLVAVSSNTWARWERGKLGIHPARLNDLERLADRAARKGKPPMPREPLFTPTGEPSPRGLRTIASLKARGLI